MQVRFSCPACKGSHILDMPETTIHMTCSRTGKHLALKLGLGGEVKARIVSDEVGVETESTEPQDEE